MTLERQTLTWILGATDENENRVNALVLEGVSPRHFRNCVEDDTEKGISHEKLAKYIFNSTKKHKKVPDRQRVLDRFPWFRERHFKSKNLAASEIAEDLQAKYKADETGIALAEIASSLQEASKNPKSQDYVDKVNEVHKLLTSKARELASIGTVARDISLKDENDQQEIKDRIYERQASERCYDIPTPWESINEYALGFNASDLCVIIGATGTGKTHALNACCITALFDNKNVLVFSNELTNEAMVDRQLSVLAGVNFTRLQRGRLTQEELIRIEDTLESLKGTKGNLVTVSDDSTMGGMGASFVHSKIIEYSPDIAFIDGAYLMDDDDNNKDKYIKAGAIALALKILAKVTKIPIVITWQVNRSKSTDQDSIAFTSDLGFHATTIIRLSCTEDQRLLSQMELNLAKSRNCPKFTILTTFDPALGKYEEIEFIKRLPDTFLAALGLEDLGQTELSDGTEILDDIPF